MTDIDPDWLGLEAKKPRLLLSATIEVQVQNPPVIDLNQAFSVPERTIAGSLVGTVVANDELGDRLAFTISNPDELKNDLDVLNVSEALVNTVPGSQTVSEDGSLVFSEGNDNQLAITDMDAGSNAHQVTLGVSHSTLTLGTTSGLNFFGGGNGQSSMTNQGTVSAINAGLDGLVYAPSPGFNGSDQLLIRTSDSGDTGFGDLLTDADTVDIMGNPG